MGFLDHGIQGSSPAFYTHRFSFLQTVDLTFGDTVGDSLSVAARDIAFTMTPSTGDATLSTDINLDNE